MVETDIFFILPFIINIEQDLVILYNSQIREIDAGKGVVALCALLFASCSGDHLAVENNIYAVGTFTGCKTEAV